MGILDHYLLDDYLLIKEIPLLYCASQVSCKWQRSFTERKFVQLFALDTSLIWASVSKKTESEFPSEDNPENSRSCGHRTVMGMTRHW